MIHKSPFPRACRQFARHFRVMSSQREKWYLCRLICSAIALQTSRYMRPRCLFAGYIVLRFPISLDDVPAGAPVYVLPTVFTHHDGSTSRKEVVLSQPIEVGLQIRIQVVIFHSFVIFSWWLSCFGVLAFQGSLHRLRKPVKGECNNTKNFCI